MHTGKTWLYSTVSTVVATVASAVALQRTTGSLWVFAVLLVAAGGFTVKVYFHYRTAASEDSGDSVPVSVELLTADVASRLGLDGVNVRYRPDHNGLVDASVFPPTRELTVDDTVARLALFTPNCARAVIAHELGHVTQRGLTAQVLVSQAACMLAFGATVIAFAVAAITGTLDSSGPFLVAVAFAALVNRLLILAAMRQSELYADAVAARLGFSTELAYVLKALSGDVFSDEFISSHPSTHRRMGALGFSPHRQFND